jgi:DNA-directed RNA polymerase I and III subunit RPAC2
MSVNEIKIKRASTAFELRGTGPLTSRTIVLGDEDHTLGNALRHVLMNDARIDFAGYCVPHPSEPIVHLRIQSNTNTTEQPLTAVEALKEACATLASQCDIVLEKLMDAASEVKEDCERMERIREEEEQRINEEAEDEDGLDEEGGEEMYEDE